MDLSSLKMKQPKKKALENKNNTDVPDGTNSRTIQVSVSHSTGKLADDGQDHTQ
jgi:hypothetical protein